MARVLIVGCGGRGRALAGELTEAGHAVRGTSRDPAVLPRIEEAGAEAVIVDPDRLGTLLPELAGVTCVVWLMGNAAGDEDAVRALHTDRLESLLAKLIDSGARGLVYEGAGAVPAPLLEEGAALVRTQGARNRMPVAVTGDDPATDRAAWLIGMRTAVDDVIAG